jgi:hypothetical protein
MTMWYVQNVRTGSGGKVRRSKSGFKAFDQRQKSTKPTSTQVIQHLSFSLILSDPSFSVLSFLSFSPLLPIRENPGGDREHQVRCPHSDRDGKARVELLKVFVQGQGALAAVKGHA